MRLFQISGKTVLVDPSWQITSKLNQRTTLSFTVVDTQELEEIQQGDSVEVYNDFNLIFGGVIDSIKTYEDSPNVIYYDISAVDFSALADKRLVAGVAENETAGYVVRSLILPILEQEGVTEGIIQDGTTVSKTVFNYIKCSDALDQLKDLTGFNWKIDSNKQLHFFSRDTNTAPFILNSSVQHYRFEKNSSMGNYRNRQYVRGSQGETAIQSLEKPSPQPDGDIRTFTMRFPLAKKPSIFVNSVPVNENDIGVNGLDTGKKWYFSYNSNTISQDNTETPLSSNDTLEVTYTGLRNLLLMLDNNVGISDRKKKETGTSGIYENISNEQIIKSTEQAIQYGQGLIQKYGEISDTIKFITNINGLEAGQLLTVQKPLFNINDSFLIESVSISAYGSDIEYQVTALDGAAIGGWEHFFKEIIRDNRDFSISEDEVIIIINTFSETENCSGVVELKAYNLLYPSETLYPTETLYLGVINTNITKYD